MSVSNHQQLNAPSGMATYINRSSLQETRAQYISGFLPARLGTMRLAPLLKRLKTGWPATSTINSTATWLSSDGQLDTLLVLSAGVLYRMDLFYRTGTTPTYNYDQRLDGQHSYIQHGTRTSVASGLGSTSTIQASIQFGTETLLCINNAPYRYYRDEPAGTDHFYHLGILTPTYGTQDPALTATTGGAMTPSQTYSYEYTFVNENQEEGSPSQSVSVTLSSSQNAVTVAGGTVSGTFQSETYANVYRLNPGAETFNFVDQVALTAGAFTFTDTLDDDTVAAGDPAPEPGENDPPTGPLAASGGFAANCSQIAVWKNRVVVNSTSDPAMIQISNAGSATQFSSLSLPTNVDDGLRIDVGGQGDNEVTGLANLGSLLCVFKRQTTSLLYGDDITDFQLRPAHNRGCQNPNSVQRCENVIFFLSDDGIYSLGYENGYAIKKVSTEIDNFFRGFTATRSSEPTSIGQPRSVQVTSAVQSNVNSFYFDNVYYLSFGDKTLCYDFIANGWADTGWGFVKTVSTYLSQSALSALQGCPGTVFLTISDLASASTEFKYYTLADTPQDTDAPAFTNAYVLTRCFDGDGPPINRKKRAKRFSLYGDVSVKPGTVIGTLTAFADGVAVESFPIYAYIYIDAPNALYQQEFTSSMTGYELYFEMRFTDNSIEWNQSRLEYSFLS